MSDEEDQTTWHEVFDEFGFEPGDEISLTQMGLITDIRSPNQLLEEAIKDDVIARTYTDRYRLDDGEWVTPGQIHTGYRYTGNGSEEAMNSV